MKATVSMLALTIAAALAGHAPLVASAEQQPAQPSEIARLAKIQLDAMSRPFDPAARQAYLAALPRDGDYYIVEGDIRLTEQEVLEYLASQSATQGRPDDRSELLVAIHDGAPDYYADSARRTLTYAIDRASFEDEKQYRTVSMNFARATIDWEQACPTCGIRFRHVEEADARPDPSKLWFVVSYRKSGPYIATAFFPHDPEFERKVLVYPPYFSTTYDRLGVFRHELGHVLGYRHEQVRLDSARQDQARLAQCWQAEPGKWQELTRYDKRSVMHYFCGELDAGSKSLDITETDREGHSRLYALQPSAPTPEAGGSLGGLVEPSAERGRVAAALRAALDKPFDAASRRALMELMPRQGEYAIVEGDIRLTEDELAVYLAARASGSARATGSPELAVNLFLGLKDYYRDPERRTLTYAVDRRSFPDAAQYETVVNAMREAARDWQNACLSCRVRFVHASDFDAAPARDGLNFIVRHVDAHGDFIAAAFFPHDPSLRRYLDVDPSYFSTSFDRVGVLRHELGHALGYRHEHIRNVPGCYKEGGQWQPLTPYDPQSVMHYFCGGAGSLKLEISRTDRTGHRALYGLGSTAGAQAGPEVRDAELVIRLQGGNVTENAVRVMQILHKNELLPIAVHTAAQGETLASIYRRLLGVPDDPALLKLATLLNEKPARTGALAPGQPVRYPDVAFSTFDFARSIEPVRTKAQVDILQKEWGSLIKKAPETGEDRLLLTGYELRLSSGSPAAISRAHKELDALKMETVIVYERPSGGTATYFGPISVQQWWRNRKPVQEIDSQGMLNALMGPAISATSPDVCRSMSTCPEIVLIDTPVYVHPDLKHAVSVQPKEAALLDVDSITDDSGDHDPAFPAGKPHQHVSVADWWDDAYHGTHLAGIIASGDNGFGLIGIHPGAEIHSWNWNDLQMRRDELAQKIIDRDTETRATGRRQIYVMASSWQPEPVHVGDQRFQDTLTDALRSRSLLLIAAAGHAESGNSIDISDATRQGPANLGDLENVIVVTACDPCGDDPRLMPRANYSTRGFVHVAAPGKDIPSTVRDGKYMTADGTSQATAFVAGVVSAMLARYSAQFREVQDIKSRIMVTARLFVRTYTTGSPQLNSALESHTRVAAGVIDPSLALLDPQDVWVKSSKVKPQDPGATMARAGRAIVWNSNKPSIGYLEEDGTRAYVGVEQILRIVRQDTSAIFFIERPRRSLQPAQRNVVRIGPVRLQVGELDQDLLALPDAGNQVLKLSDIEDLLLPHPFRLPSP